jgi:two-component system sensor histidine kinase RegB
MAGDGLGSMSASHDSYGLDPARQLQRAAGYALAAEVPKTATTDLAPNLALPWVLRLRYGMVAGEAAIILAMAYVFRLDFPVVWTLTPLAAILASNLLLGRMHDLSSRFPQDTLGAAFVLDTFALTVILGLTGGPVNPFSLLYLVQITLSAVVLHKIWTWALGILAAICFGLLFFLHLPLAALQDHHPDQGLSPHLVGMWIAFVIAAALISFFTGKISDALRHREREVLELQEQVAKHERLASLITLAAGAAHELGTPLSTIAVVAKELEKYASAPSAPNDIREDTKLIRSEVERCRLILERMSVQGAEPMGEAPQSVQVRDLFMQVLAQFPESQRPFVEVELDDEALAAILPRQATAQSLAALIQNALDANFNQRPIVITAFATDDGLRISIRDQGHGMPDNVLRRIAEPFFTTKEPGKGMGLGTFLVRSFAERLGGHVLFDSIFGQGTTVTLELPLQSQRRNVHA